jgi:hypothetical protein
MTGGSAGVQENATDRRRRFYAELTKLTQIAGNLVIV